MDNRSIRYSLSKPLPRSKEVLVPGLNLLDTVLHISMILHVNMFSFETRTLESAFQFMMDMSPNGGARPQKFPGT